MTSSVVLWLIIDAILGTATISLVTCSETVPNSKEAEGSVTPNFFLESPPGDGSEAKEKRAAQTIMRFGKRKFNELDDDLDFDKRAHSFIHFGKRMDTDPNFVLDLIRYFRQREVDDGWKRGHNIMRFGKRKDESYPEYAEIDDDESDMDKRAHAMMRFGKREDEDVKRAHAMMHFGKREDEDVKRAHAMMHFGKRGENHNIMRFGKRGDEDASDEYLDLMKRVHAMMHFGKRRDGTHNIMHFGKREPQRIMHFGKRYDMEGWGLNDDDKRAHAFMHFGKRLEDEMASNPSEELDFSEPELMDKRHQMMRFGRDASDKRHNMMRFGKKSGTESSTLPVTVTKREAITDLAKIAEAPLNPSESHGRRRRSVAVQSEDMADVSQETEKAHSPSSRSTVPEKLQGVIKRVQKREIDPRFEEELNRFGEDVMLDDEPMEDFYEPIEPVVKRWNFGNPGPLSFKASTPFFLTHPSVHDHLRMTSSMPWLRPAFGTSYRDAKEPEDKRHKMMHFGRR